MTLTEPLAPTGLVWRDAWGTKPVVIILSDSDPASGELSDSLMMLASAVNSPVRLSNSAGRFITVEIPPEDCSEAAVIHGIDLKALEEVQ